LIFFFFFNDTATTEIYTTRHTLSLHDALPISCCSSRNCHPSITGIQRSSKRSEEHTSELQSRLVISYAVFCLKKKKKLITVRTRRLSIKKNKENMLSK